MKVLVINAGSSSVKYHLYNMPQAEVLAHGVVERIGEESSNLSHFFNGKTHTVQRKVEDVGEGMELILDTLVRTDVGVIQDFSEINAVGHRVVHGGEEFTYSVNIDEKVIASIEKYADLAPLHNPPNLAGIRAIGRRLPDAKQVACFDTAFHSTIPKAAYMYALPYELYEKYGIRRYGFHGISHRYVARRAASIMGRGKYNINAVTCHLGNGCSITAVKQGRSIDTSMGFTPLEGVPMGTRSGDLDPSILFYLGDKGYDVKALKELCNKKSGLLGISGVSNDVRNLVELSDQGDPRAQLAIDIFCYRIKKYIGVYCAVLDTVNAVVFTGGIGENAVFLRQQICTGLNQVGIQLDEEKNKMVVAKEAEISTDGSRVKVFVIPANEQVAIANDTYELTRCEQPIVSK
ncbi:MAG: acetate/propionate family kinase [Phycisphaerae bacterium]|nr:acetate kinase [Phycisphaerae bacterium]NIP53728.1 acetate kinase [Phycisphaerae bacterium]NIS52650.1 acetate kinase [Phycisphaerae bacterium]NIU10129.1 acetate kinase [Phycisphaerae bacterium]NIV02723.1 acetate/propionate family kinase [Phycisphaerae bacterium]